MTTFIYFLTNLPKIAVVTYGLAPLQSVHFSCSKGVLAVQSLVGLALTFSRAAKVNDEKLKNKEANQSHGPVEYDQKMGPNRPV